MIIQNSLSVLMELSSIEDKINLLEETIKAKNLEINTDELLISALNSQIK